MITLIVASDSNGVIGADGTLPWHYRADLQRFKARTMGGVLIMGRRTWESLPKPLPGREAVVMTTDPWRPSRHPAGSCRFASCWDEIERVVDVLPGANNVWVAGGALVYREALYYGHIDAVDYTLVPDVDVSAAKEVTRLPENLAAIIADRPGDGVALSDDERLRVWTWRLQ